MAFSVSAFGLDEEQLPRGWIADRLDTLAFMNPEQIGAEYSHSEIAYLDIGNVAAGVAGEPAKLSPSDAPSRAQRIVRSQDTILSTVRPGNRAYAFVRDAPENLIVSTGFAVLRAKREAADPRFLYYLATSDPIINYLASIAEEKTAYPSVNPGDIAECVVPIPPMSEQRAIAHILGTLDDKIELNRRMSETLEAMARALFKSWFIDFDPVRRNVARSRNQPSPPAPLPGGEGRHGLHYRGGDDFAGLLETVRDLRKAQTPAEDVFWELVRDRRLLGLKFRRQHQVGDYIADFYCHGHRMIIELDGSVHSARRKKDHKRDAWMEARGFTVLRFSNEQLLDAPESVLAAITHVVAGTALPPLPLGEGRGEGSVEELDRLFPDSFENSELGEIPKGWRVGCVDDDFELTMGQSPPGHTYNEVGDGLPFYQGRTDFGFRFPTRRVYCTAPTRLATKGDTLISVRAPVGDINMAAEDCAIGRGVAAARHKTGSRSYSYQFMRAQADVFERFEAEGTVFGSIGKKDFHAIACVVPPWSLVEEFERRVALLDGRIEVAYHESRTLAALRDALLPKLISGELRVKDAEKFVGASV